ncbi:uracil-DNA glycosylase [Erwinia sp. CPCC 100877]|nr:uracil-DNA glycosylase [Erwinia sp. CPCC 100877]
MDYPKELVDQAKKELAGHQLEGFLSGQGPKNAVLMLIGEAPGKTEVDTNVPFSGRAGKKLDGWLKIAGLNRSDIYITSAVRSRPFHIKKQPNRNGTLEIKYPNRTPTQKEVTAFAPLLDFEIETIQPKILVPMGNIGLQRLLGKNYSISAYHGKSLYLPIFHFDNTRQKLIETPNPYPLFPLYHPAAVFYNQSLEQTIQEDWLKLAEFIQNDRV